MAVIAVVLLIWYSKRIAQLKRYMLAIAVMFASAKVLRFIYFLADDNTKGVDQFQQIFVYSNTGYKLIVIFAVNIFCNLLSVGFDAIDGFFEEIASELPDEWVGYELGEETITHYFSVDTYIKDGAYDKENDCLKFNLSELFFAHNDSVDEDYDTITEEWQSEFTSPKERFYSEQIVVNAVFFSPKDIVDAEKIENSYKNDVELYGEITSDGVLYIYGVNQHLKKYDAQSGYMELATVSLRTENAETKEHFDFYFSIPFNFVKVNSDGTLKYFYIYSYDDEVTNTEVDLNDQYYPDIEELEEYVEFIAFSENNADESIPVSVEYTEQLLR
jgi:hypothetical protein